MNHITTHLYQLGHSLAQSAHEYFSAHHVAKTWRTLLKIAIVLAGFAAFGLLELLLGYGIIGNQLYLIIVLFLGLPYILLVIKSPLLALCVWIVASPLSTYFLETHFSGGMNFLSFNSVSYFLFFVVIIIGALANREKFRFPNVGECLLLLFTLYVITSIILRNQATPAVMNLYFIRMGCWPFIYFITKGCIKKTSDIEKCITALLVSCGIIAASMIYEHFAGQSVYSLMFHTSIPLQWDDAASGRAMGPFRSPIHATQLLAPAAFFAFQRAISARTRITKSVYVVLFFASISSIIFTYTRNNYVSLIILFMLVPLLASYKRKIYMDALIAFVLIVGVAIIPVFITNKDLNERMTDPANAEHRIIFMKTSINMIKHHPWFGVGWGNSPDLTSQYVVDRAQYEGLGGSSTTTRLRPTLVHNTYLNIAQENGLVGAAILYLGIFILFFNTIKTYILAPSQRSLGKNFAAVIVAATVMWFVATIAYNNEIADYPNALFWIYIATSIRYKELLKQRREVLPSVNTLSDQEAGAYA